MLIQADSLAPFPLADGSVHCCISSPPYWGLRSYLAGDDPLKAHELGSEPVPDCLGWATGAPCGVCFVCHMVAVYREVWRVLRDDGTAWLNLGDSYAMDAKWGGASGGKNYTSAAGGLPRARRHTGLKPKDLCGIPWRVALALQADGWTLRSDIIWAKPNPMPESVTDRPTKAHEYLFLLAKSQRYFYDAEAVKESVTDSTVDRLSQDVAGQTGSTRAHAGGKTNGNMKAVGHMSAHMEGTQRNDGERWRNADGGVAPRGTRNRRTVWEIPTAPYSGAHFATYPPALVEPCILAGCPSGGTVLDPFCGSGTTGLVAKLHGRRFVGMDLSREYLSTLALPRAEGRQTAASMASLPLFSQAGR